MSTTKRTHPNWIEAYLEYTKYSEAPERFHRWTAISTIAGALRRRVWIDEGYFQWTPNFFIFFVAPPGIVSKSTTISIGTGLLKRLKSIHFGPSAVTWQSLVQRLSEVREDIRLPGGEFVAMSALTIVAKELGTFLDPNNREMIDVLVDWWDGRLEDWQKSTKMDGVETIFNPWINMIAATTPAWIAKNFHDYFIGGGFASRTIFVYGETKRRLVAYPSKLMGEGQKGLERTLVSDLTQISSMVGQYKLSTAAVDWGTDWYEKLYTENADKFDNERLSGYMARKQTHLHKTAIILAASRTSDLIINVEDLVEANSLLDSTEADLPKVFSQMGREIAQQHIGTLWSMIQDRGKVYEKDLYREVYRLMRYSVFEDTIISMMKAGLVERWQDDKTSAIFLTATLPEAPEEAAIMEAALVVQED